MANMSNEKLKELIKKEEDRIEGYKKKKAELEEKIKKSEGIVQKYKVMLNNNQYLNFIGMVQEKGISLDEIMTAIQQGDLLALQERMEEQAEEKEE